MRVLAGKYKGRVLKTVPNISVRPATSKVKAAIFNILQSRVDWRNAVVLDLYAGSGSVGIEALSRGAERAVFVEFDRSALQFLKKNIESISLLSEAQVVFADVKKFLTTSSRAYDVVFCDPPYAVEYLAELPSMVFESGAVKEEGILIMEHPTRFEFTPNSLWEIVVQKTYGRTSISMFQYRKEAA